jgi:gentisate 1,2-dioxygenase
VTSCHQGAALYHIPGEAFDRNLADVPAHLFAEEQRRALGPGTPTGLIPMDLWSALGTAYPATTPAMLARYVVVRAGDGLTHHFAATGEVYYVARGSGRSSSHTASIAWRTGDVFVLPGAGTTRHEAISDALLVCFTNEPELAFAGVQPPLPEQNTVVHAAHFDAATIDAKLDLVHRRDGEQRSAGKSVIFATTAQPRMLTILPSLTAAVNTLEPSGNQRPHRHNAAALTLAIEATGVHSMVAGHRIDWIPFGLMVTPPQAVHSHHNRGPRMMKSFVVQDGALYYQLRNPGFAWTD